MWSVLKEKRFFKLKDRGNKNGQKSHNWLVWLITAVDGEAGGPCRRSRGLPGDGECVCGEGGLGRRVYLRSSLILFQSVLPKVFPGVAGLIEVFLRLGSESLLGLCSGLCFPEQV